MKLSIYLPDDLAEAVEAVTPDSGWSERCQLGLGLLLAGATEDQIRELEERAADNARARVRELFKGV